jgi:hypothetical protein
MPNHPLGLQPGDIILGYDGIPWIKLYNELLDDGLPSLGDGGGEATPAGALHRIIMNTGCNWGLFDTIDVKKYPTNEIVHYPTFLLASINPPYFVSTEQLPVDGVVFPDIQNNKMVSWGIVKGTSIGYIYVWHWWGNSDVLFSQAVDELMHKYQVQGIILDFRMNWGGAPNNANSGFSKLFNFDPLANDMMAKRIPGNDHLAFSFDHSLRYPRFIHAV